MSPTPPKGRSLSCFSFISEMRESAHTDKMSGTAITHLMIVKMCTMTDVSYFPSSSLLSDDQCLCGFILVFIQLICADLTLPAVSCLSVVDDT